MTLHGRDRIDPPSATLYDAAFDAVVSVDAGDHVVHWSDGAERVFGYARHEAMGARLADLLIPPALRAAYDAARARIAAGDASKLLHRRLELRALTRDGGDFPVELVVTPDAGSQGGLVGLIRDLSGVAEVERRRDEMQVRLERTEELASTGSWSLDLRNGAVIWSDGIYRIHGIDPRTATPSSEAFLASLHPDDRTSVDELIQGILRDPVSQCDVSFGFRVVWPDGTVHELESRAQVELDEQGSAARWVGTTHDVTDRRLRERELQARDAVAHVLGRWTSLAESAPLLLERLGVALDCAVGALWVCDPVEHRLDCRAFWSAKGLDVAAFARCVGAVVVEPGVGTVGTAWKSQRPLVSDGVEGICGSCREHGSELGLRSGLAIPTTGRGGPLVVIAFYSTERMVWSESLMRTLTGIGWELGHFLDRRRAEIVGVRLSPRELEVLQLAAEGHTGPRIAELLFLSPSTIKTHFENIYAKLGVSDRAAAVAHAVRTGIVQ